MWLYSQSISHFVPRGKLAGKGWLGKDCFNLGGQDVLDLEKHFYKDNFAYLPPGCLAVMKPSMVWPLLISSWTSLAHWLKLLTCRREDTLSSLRRSTSCLENCTKHLPKEVWSVAPLRFVLTKTTLRSLLAEETVAFSGEHHPHPGDPGQVIMKLRKLTIGTEPWRRG